MKRISASAMGLTVLLAFGVMTAQAGTKVQICHVPPGNPDNFHTITVSENALPAHLAHGDFPGSCAENCGTLCDDGNACTIDACDETETCLADHPPVDCDDTLLCTADSCDPEAGCQYAPIVCDDGDNCTIDTCSPRDGQCKASKKNCGPLGICLSETGDCDFPCDGITCEPSDQCHQAGECVLPGDCTEGDAKPDGTECDDGHDDTVNDVCTDGVCAGGGRECFTSFDYQGPGSYEESLIAISACEALAGCRVGACEAQFTGGYGEHCVILGDFCELSDQEMVDRECTNICNPDSSCLPFGMACRGSDECCSGSCAADGACN